MAKFTPGAMTGRISGSLGSTVFSHNRNGPYMRTRSVPVKATTNPATDAKARLATYSSAWAALTAAQQEAWRQFAQSVPVIDTLGQPQIMTGHQAYVGLNTRLQLAGDTALSLPPTGVGPTALTTLSLAADIGAGAFEITFAATPLGAGVRLWSRVAVVTSAGVQYIQNLLKLVDVSAAAQATGLDIQTEIEARFGTLQVGAVIHLLCSTFDGATGLLSAPLRTSAVVTTT